MDDAWERLVPFSLKDIVDVTVLKSHVDDGVSHLLAFYSTKHALEAADIRGYYPKISNGKIASKKSKES